MKYVELLGMGASGKTTTLRCLRRTLKRSKSLQVWLEEDVMSVFRRAVGFGAAPSGVRGVILDRWASGAFEQHPALFSEVLSAVDDVWDRGRGRMILLNYWRSRVRLYSHVARSSRKGLMVTDEGLAQTVLTTWWARNHHTVAADTPLGLEKLIDSLPSNRCIIVVQTPIDILLARRKKNADIGRAQLETTLAMVNEIARRSAKNGCDVRWVDGRGEPSEVAERLMSVMPVP